MKHITFNTAQRLLGESVVRDITRGLNAEQVRTFSNSWPFDVYAVSHDDETLYFSRGIIDKDDMDRESLTALVRFIANGCEEEPEDDE